MTRRVISTAAMVCMGVALALAQGKPNFSGTWELDLERTRAENKARASAAGGATMGGGNMMSAGGPPPVTAVTIAQTAGTVTVDRVSGQVMEKVVLKLDGTESVTTTPRTTLKLKSRWDGAKLVSEGTTETKLSDGSGVVSATLKEVRWIEKDGYMVVESTRVVASSAGSQAAGAPRPTVQYFKKK